MGAGACGRPQPLALYRPPGRTVNLLAGSLRKVPDGLVGPAREDVDRGRSGAANSGDPARPAATDEGPVAPTPIERLSPQRIVRPAGEHIQPAGSTGRARRSRGDDSTQGPP